MKHAKLAILARALRAASVLVCGFCAAYTSFAASPAATQAWVKRHVAALSKPTWAPVSRSLDINGTNVTIRFSFRPMTNAALRVVSSGDPKMPAGVCFAKTAPGVYQNFTNRFCDAITTRRVLSGITVATNSVPWRTNYNYVAWAELSVDGVVYKGARQGSRYVCLDPTDLSTNRAEIVVAPCAITDAARAAVLTPQPSVSWLSLVVGSACAGWALGDKEYTDGRKWVRHYLWQGDGSPPAEVSVTVYVDGVPFDVPLSNPLVLGYFDGLDACDAKKNAAAFNMPDEELQDQLNAWLEEIALWLFAEFGIYPEDFWDRYNYDPDVSDFLDPQLNGSLPPTPDPPPDCPQKGEDPEPVKKEPPPPAPGGGGPKCNHDLYGATGKCGNWRCANCGATLSGGPSGHAFVEVKDNCQKCMNTFKNAVCGEADTDPAHHFYGKDCGGDDQGCICRHGGFQMPHPGFAVVGNGEWQHTPALHWQTEECTRCPFQRQANRGSHVPGGVEWKDNGDGTCSMAMTCTVCGFEYSRGFGSPHTQGAPNGKVTDLGDGTHGVWYDCGRCGRANVGNTPQPHEWTPKGPPGECDEFDGDQHYFSQSCLLNCGVAPRKQGEGHGDWAPVSDEYSHNASNHWKVVKCGHCGQTQPGDASPHGWQWQLSASKAQRDVLYCPDCGKTDFRDHSWKYADMVHWCENGGGHLMEAHDGDPCSVCDHSDDYHYSYTYCGCSCYSYTVHDGNGDYVAGPFDNCAAGFGVDRCGCPACLDGNCQYCTCCNVYNVGTGSMWSICDSRIEGDGFLKALVAYGSGISHLNGDDPVYEIGDYALTNACSGFASLETVDFNYVTNVGDYAFQDAFKNCPKLRHVGFQRLEEIGVGAFFDAFTNCPALKRIEFPSVQAIAYDSFVHVHVPVLAFPSVRVVDYHMPFSMCYSDLEFAMAEYADHLAFETHQGGRVSMPSATNLAEMAFYQSSVTNLYLPRISTNRVAEASCVNIFPDRPDVLHFGLRSGCRVQCSDGVYVVP